MKLRNKKTGEVYNACRILFGESLEGLEKTNWETLKEFCEDWEDIGPTEPLIEDEKIRKAVRAWAWLYDDSAIRAHIGEDFVSLYKDEVNGYSSSVGIDLSPDVFRELIDNHYYTIAELCGEEEE